MNAASRVLGLLGLAIGSALGGLLAVADVSLPVLVEGVVFIGCAALMVLLVPESNPRPAHS